MSRYIRRGLFEYLTARSLSRAGQRQITTITRPRNYTPILVAARTGQTSSELLTKVRWFASRTDRIGIVRQKGWAVLRILFMLTGGVLWSMPVFLYIGIKTGLIKVELEEENESESNRQDGNERLFSVFDVSKDDEQSTRAREINEKSSALMKIWNKLKMEDGILRKFGDPVDLIGYRGKSWAEDNLDIFDTDHANSNPSNEIQDFDTATEIKVDERKNRNGIVEWCVVCVIAGPKLTGILELEFNKVNSEWVPISLRIEGLQKTGNIICNVSGPLPNGVTRFTRLSND